MKFSEKFYVGYSDTNKDLRLSDSAILRMFENIATMHSEAVGDGMSDTTSRWFLTAYKVVVHKRPKLGEYVECATWSRDARGFIASREFEIYTKNGDIAVTAISNWARIDTVTGRPERVTEQVKDMYGTDTELKNFQNPWIEKLKEPKEYEICKSYYIDRNVIDANNHMNNVCYLDLADCILPDDVYEAGRNGFEILYRKAISYSETVKCCYAKTDDGYFVVMKSDDGSEIKAIIKFI